MNANQQQSGDYEVHDENCHYGKLVNTPLELGNYSSCAPAVHKAIELYGSEAQQKRGRINGCYYCCKPCHTS